VKQATCILPGSDGSRALFPVLFSKKTLTTFADCQRFLWLDFLSVRRTGNGLFSVRQPQ
jgi:hypothetical protein